MESTTGTYATLEECEAAIVVVKESRSFTIKGELLKDTSQDKVKEERSKKNKKIAKDLKGGR